MPKRKSSLARWKPRKVSASSRRLEAQGYLFHTVEGQTFVYRATAAPRELRAGSAEQFVLGMVDEKLLTPAQLEKFARKVKRLTMHPRGLVPLANEI